VAGRRSAAPNQKKEVFITKIKRVERSENGKRSGLGWGKLCPASLAWGSEKHLPAQTIRRIMGLAVQA